MGGVRLRIYGEGLAGVKPGRALVAHRSPRTPPCASNSGSKRRLTDFQCCIVYAIRNQMADEPNNLVLEHLRHIRGAVDAVREDVREIKTRVGHLEHQYASLSTRMDRLDDRLDKIEKRLNLADAPT
jgi:septal ring factor EnvC (AmiA/AmiB activator)